VVFGFIVGLLFGDHGQETPLGAKRLVSRGAAARITNSDWRQQDDADTDAAVSSVSPAKSIVTIATDGATRRGALAALAAYGAWGLFPLLFDQLDGVDAALIVAHRIVWSLLLVGAILVVSGRWAEVKTALMDRQTVISVLISAPLLTLNWGVYVWAVEANKVLETSFGYFLNPLVSVLLGMVLLGERQRPWQAIAIGIAAVAMGIQALGVGGVPWVALTLAVSFALYGYFRKTVKASSATGLFLETLVLIPFALGVIGYSLVTGGAGPHGDLRLMSWLVATGPATSFALLLFAYAVQRLRLTTIGMFQYLAPSIHFLLAITVFHEELNLTRLISFALIWLSLIIFTADSFRRRAAT
jgi:chloramphenicol-sensitive protein RarD